MEKIVEIANFQQPEKAELLAGLLQAGGIECYIRNEVSSRLLRGYLDVGARVEVMEDDVPLALELMQKAGYVLPGDDMQDEYEKGNTSLAHRIPILRNLSFEKQMILVVGLIIGLLALIIYLQSYFSAENIS